MSENKIDVTVTPKDPNNPTHALAARIAEAILYPERVNEIKEAYSFPEIIDESQETE